MRSARFALLTVTNGVAACLMIAAVSLLSVEAIGPAHALILAGAILYGRWSRRPSPPPLLWDALALVALLLFPFDLFVLSRDLIGAALRLLSFVVIYRCTNLTGGRELRQALSLSFIQILAAAASTTEIRFSVLLAAYLAMSIWTLMAIASARDHAPAAVRRSPAGRPVLQVTVSTLAIGVTLFFVIPHLGTGYFHPGASMIRPQDDALTGFADRIELGSIGRIKKSRGVVMRVKLRQDPASPIAAMDETAPMLWRGVALDTFDGRSWSVARPDKRWVRSDNEGRFDVGIASADGSPVVEAEFSVQPMLAPVLFSLAGATRVISDEIQAVGVDDSGALHLPSPRMFRLNYRVVSPDPVLTRAGFGSAADADGEPRKPAPGPSGMARYLTLPRIDPEVGRMATAVTAGAATPFEKARRLEEHLRSHYAYTLDINDAGVADPVAYFLLQRNAGHCEYFATAMAVLLRHAGIPSRVVNGFATGEWSPLTESFIVRQSDAHSWVEAWFAGRGWVTFDPTPSAQEVVSQSGLMARLSRAFDRIEILWDTWVIGLDLLDQQSLASTLYDTSARAAAAVTASLNRIAAWATGFRSEGWSRAALGFGVIFAAAGLFRLASRAGAGLLLRLGAVGRRGGNGRRPVSPAAEEFRRFEARWAARGVRREPGQTPLEFAHEIERRCLDTPGAAARFVQAYYQTRYGA